MNVQAGQGAGLGQAKQVELPGQRRPVSRFVAAADGAAEVQPPGLRLLAVGKAQIAERDTELGAPAIVTTPGGDLPRAIPVEIEPAHRRATAAALTFTGQLAVIFLAGRIGAEDEAVLSIQVGVEDHLEAVGLIQ